MRNILIFISITFLFFSCKEKDQIISLNKEASEPALVGKWQVSASYYSTGSAEQIKKPVNNGDIYDFNKDMTFRKYNTGDPIEGLYETKGDSLILKYDESGRPEQFIYLFTINSDILSISPVTIMCMEGCSEELKRIH